MTQTNKKELIKTHPLFDFIIALAIFIIALFYTAYASSYTKLNCKDKNCTVTQNVLFLIPTDKKELTVSTFESGGLSSSENKNYTSIVLVGQNKELIPFLGQSPIDKSQIDKAINDLSLQLIKGGILKSTYGTIGVNFYVGLAVLILCILMMTYKINQYLNSKHNSKTD